MDFKIERGGPTTVMISIANRACSLSNETIKELQNIETITPFIDKLSKEIKKQNIEMANALKGSLKNSEEAFEIMDKIKAFALEI